MKEEMQMNAIYFSKAQLMSIFLAMKHSFKRLSEENSTDPITGRYSRKRKILSDLVRSCFSLLISNHLIKNLANEKEARFIQALSDQFDDYVSYFDLDNKYDIQRIEEMLVELLRNKIAEDFPAKMQVALAAILAKFYFHYDPKDWSPKGSKDYMGYMVHINKQRDNKIGEVAGWLTGYGGKWRWPKFLFGWDESPIDPSAKEKLTEKFEEYIERKYGTRIQEASS